MQLHGAGRACPVLILPPVVPEPVEGGDSDGHRLDQRPRTCVAKAAEEGAGDSTSPLPKVCSCVCFLLSASPVRELRTLSPCE